MDTNKITTLAGNVNVTLHKCYLSEHNSNYARVQRNTASMSNVIATALKETSRFKEEDLVAAQMVFKRAVLTLLEQGNAVNVLELGSLYPTARGSISSDNPSLSELPELSLSFTPSSEAIEAVQKADVASAILADSSPSISLIEDLFTHQSGEKLTQGKVVRIRGQRLKIAGTKEETGLYFAPLDEDEKIDTSGANWIRLDDSGFFKNTASFLEFFLPESLEKGKKYALIIRTAAGRGKSLNKTIRSMRYEKPVLIA